MPSRARYCTIGDSTNRLRAVTPRIVNLVNSNGISDNVLAPAQTDASLTVMTLAVVETCA